MTDPNVSTTPKNHGSAPQDILAPAAKLGARAGKQLQKMASGTERLATEHPWAAAGALLGLGAILGALAHRVFGHRPTVSELLHVDRLPSRAKRAVSRYF